MAATTAALARRDHILAVALANPKLNQTQLARLLGVSPAAVSKFMVAARGERSETAPGRKRFRVVRVLQLSACGDCF